MYKRLTHDVFRLMWHGPQGEEQIDCFPRNSGKVETWKTQRAYAREMRDEYNLVYGGGVLIRCGRERNV